MPQISIERSGCRSCSLCRDVCPTQVFDLDAQEVAVAARPKDCIGCTSCESICPSRCLEVTDVARQQPFYRIEENVQFVSKFLRRKPVQDEISSNAWTSAIRDVSVRLTGLTDSITETMGRGQKAVGRKAGKLAAEHLPEMYEGHTLPEVLTRLQRRFAGAFDFASEVTADGSTVSIRFEQCALRHACEAGAAEPGKALICSLFHEYWAGLVGAFGNRNFSVAADVSRCPCIVTLTSRD
ncbi:MAG: 4Fe-4S dicluster domain-containing protein [Polyangiaceae bacterium]